MLYLFITPSILLALALDNGVEVEMGWEIDGNAPCWLDHEER
jgi:hypothetical protein